MRLLLTLLIALQATVGYAQVSEFPADAKPLDEATLRLRLSGKSFRVLIPPGRDIWFEFEPEGIAHLDTPTSSLQGPWHVEGSRFCVSWTDWKAGCYDVRDQDSHLFYRKLSDGSIAELVPAELSIPPTNPYNGKWRATNPALWDADVVIEDGRGSWYFFARSYARFTNGCLLQKKPVQVVRYSNIDLVVFVNSSAALMGCQDFRIHLRRIDDRTLEGGGFRFVRQ